MKYTTWRWLLPALQLAFAVGCHIYGPHQYRVKAEANRVTSNILYFSQNDPAPVERVSRGISFPALMISFPLREAETLIYRRNGEYTLISFRVKDLGFYAGIALFWFAIGRKVGVKTGVSVESERCKL